MSNEVGFITVTINGETQTYSMHTCKPVHPEPVAAVKKPQGKVNADGSQSYDAAEVLAYGMSQPGVREFRDSFIKKPEPVAAEMPEAIDHAIYRLLKLGSPLEQNLAATHLESFWRTHAAQPAPAVAMTEELERVLEFAWKCADGNGTIRSDIAYARQQAAEAGKVRLPKVRGALNYFLTSLGDEHLAPGYPPLTRITERAKLTAALAELDAAEGGK